jgi:peptidoglycan/xylan/chitin deacetylase (PgdA/CDA1 family)
MIGILYSADYEIFLGANYAPEAQVLLDPTNRLLDTCEELGVPMTLFCDVACLWRYREEGLDEFPDAVEEQLRDALRRGHDVQTHMHPHWLYAERVEGRWTAPPDRFLLGRLADDADEVERRAVELLERAASYLESVTGRRPTAFRAGNYGLQPHADRVIAALLATGHVVDSSVVPGFVQRNEVNDIDYSAVARRAPYRLSPEHGLAAPAAGGGLLEVPVAAATYGPRDAPRAAATKLYRALRPLPVPPPRGVPIQIALGDGGRAATARRLMRKALQQRTEILELGVSAGHLLRVTRDYLESLEPNGDVLFSFSCHPKTLVDLSFDALRAYHRELERRLGGELRALSFAEVAATAR